MAPPPPPPLHPHHHCVLTRFRCPATGTARFLIRLGIKPFCCSSVPSRTPPPLHGPSLRRGRRPLDYPDPFARTFDLAALRVPAAACAPLERRLRGHLLNWPRVHNVIRLRNDQGLLSLSPPPPGYPAEEPGGPAPRATAVLRREKLVRELNARGFLRFPNLARLSRPSPLARKRRERKGDGGDEETCEPDKDKAYVVEVAGERREDDDDWKGLVGEEGIGRDTWRIGSTRLLLLEERYAERKVDELPEAVKDVLDHETQHDESSAFELIRCHLTLFYTYWSMSEVLEVLLPEGVIIPTGFETIGHIAHLNLRDEHMPYKKLIASVVLDKNKPKIQTVVNKTDVIQNNYRTMQLEVLAGNGSLRTMVIESGLRFQVDLGTVYWNSRLATERQRLVNIFRNLDVVCDMFSGVGPLAISAAKKVKYVYANDINPNAVGYLERNMVLNKLEKKIEMCSKGFYAILNQNCIV
uniref:SAM-dependent methyltransferase TRM5/TYW2-type domain-containing protein n=1 Tax=Zea mays TaxID=4577 RepID=A0A804N3M2_MAIZE